MNTTQPALKTGFAELLRNWRRIRGKSQFELSLVASVSARHISFIESGRSAPSKEMVITLANALNVPFREQNTLLSAAGFSPVYRETQLEAPELTGAKKALDLILKNHEPFPAVVLNRSWDIVATNAAANKFFGFLLGDGDKSGQAPNVLRLMFTPALARRYVKNWPDVAKALLHRVYREAVGGSPDEKTSALLHEILSFPGVPSNWRMPDLSEALAPLVPVIFEKDGLEFRFFSVVTTLGTPQDITLQELRVECFYPGDETAETNIAKIS
jgi:transcriptional regulator with XRE-family HTH domain